MITILDFRSMMASQTRIFLCIMLALPLIGVRLLYSLISEFGNNSQFNVVTGDVTIRLGMASIEEFLVVVMYAILGVMTPRSVAESEANGRGDYGGEAAHAPTYVVGGADTEGRGHSRSRNSV